MWQIQSKAGDARQIGASAAADLEALDASRRAEVARIEGSATERAEQVFVNGDFAHARGESLRAAGGERADRKRNREPNEPPQAKHARTLAPGGNSKKLATIAAVATLLELGPTLAGTARAAISAALRGIPLALPEPRAELAHPVFVTLRSAAEELRGCVGALTPREPDVVHETARSAVLAATADPRFSPVTLAELASLSIEVSVLMPEEPVHELAELDPRRYGVVVRDAAGQRGLLLPDVPGVEDAAQQVAIARRKAGIPAGSRVTLARFAVRKFGDRVGAVGIEPTTSSV